MDKKEIIWTKNSLIEIENILFYYIDRNKNNNYSIKLLENIEKRIELISSFPQIGSKTDLSNVEDIGI